MILNLDYHLIRASQVALVVRKSPANAGDLRDLNLIPGSGRSLRTACQPTPVFLLGEAYEQRRLGYSPQGHKELDTTECLSTSEKQGLPTLTWRRYSSVAQSCLTLCNPMGCSTPGLPVHHQLPELTQTHVSLKLNEYSVPISFSIGWMEWLDLLAVQGILKRLLLENTKLCSFS